MMETNFIVWDKKLREFRYDFLNKSGDNDNDWILFFKQEEYNFTPTEKRSIQGLNNPYPRQRFILFK